VLARQRVGSKASAWSAPIAVEQRKEPYRPRILGPVAYGDREIPVSGVTPGALVTLYFGQEGETKPGQGQVIGWTRAAESLVWVKTSPVPAGVEGKDRVWASSRLCKPEQVKQSSTVTVITSPAASHPRAPFGAPASPIGTRLVDLGTFMYNQPDTSEGYSQRVDPEAGFTWHTFDVELHGGVQGGSTWPTTVRGKLYYPKLSAAQGIPRLPLVVISHGYWWALEHKDTQDDMYSDSGKAYGGLQPDTYLGYEYLAHHLARWGFVVLSVDMDDVAVDELEWMKNVQKAEWARANLIREAVRALTIWSAANKGAGDPASSFEIDATRVGLVGHSMSGEAVVLSQWRMAQDEKSAKAAGESAPEVRAVVSIAPTSHTLNGSDTSPLHNVAGASYLQLFGSRDHVLSYGGLGLFDQAMGPKTLIFIGRGLHNPFNALWASGLNIGEVDEEGMLSWADHEVIARSSITALLAEVLGEPLQSDDRYLGYLQSLVRPRELRALDLHVQYVPSPGATLIDDFGHNAQKAGKPKAEWSNKSTNALGGDVKLIPKSGSPGSPWSVWTERPIWAGPAGTSIAGGQSGRVLDLGWDQPGGEYTTALTPSAAVPEGVVAMRIDEVTSKPPVNENPPGVQLDLYIALEAQPAQGTSVTVPVRAGIVGQIGGPADAWQYEHSATSRGVADTLLVPLDAFLAADPAMEGATLKKLRLQLSARSTGRIVIRDIALLG